MKESSQRGGRLFQVSGKLIRDLSTAQNLISARCCRNIQFPHRQTLGPSHFTGYAKTGFTGLYSIRKCSSNPPQRTVKTNQGKLA
jgi:hypothetical protein